MLFLTIFLLAIVAGYPIWDYFYMKKIKSGLVSKWRMYSQIMITQWVSVFILLGYWLLTGLSVRELFIYENPLMSFVSQDLLDMAMGAGASLLIVILAVAFSKKMRKKISDALTDESIQFLLPSSIAERLFFLMIAITAGVCEEIIFRGAMVYYLGNLPFELSVFAIGVISSVLFGLVHLYQGWKGVLITGYLGGVLFFFFAGTGYLWVPILFHTIIDAKFVFLPNKKRTVDNNNIM